MIAGLEGILESRGSDFAIVKVGGVSLRVYMPSSTLANLGAIGERLRLHTYLQVKEDNLALYGFASDEELALFEMLIGVAGVGPRAGLAMLSAMNPERLTLAIASGNIDLLTQVPGMGKKIASRLVLELKGKLERGWVGVPQFAEANADVAAALRSLGYSATEAASAIAALPDSPDLPLEEKVRLALQQFGSR